MSRTKSDSQVEPPHEYHTLLPDVAAVVPLSCFIFKGTYHLYYTSHDPAQCVLGHLSSTDLITWKSMQSNAFSGLRCYGSVVHDHKNISGLGSTTKHPLLAFYSYQDKIHMSYSLDIGDKWQDLGKNPVLDPGKKGIRDPFVFWHDKSAKWIMIVVIEHEYKVFFYTSKNLIKWEFLNDFGGHPSFKKKWSHVRMLPMNVENQTGVSKWIMIVNDTGEYSECRYFVGEFDGKRFLCDHALDQVLIIDYSRDCYAPAIFSQANHKNVIIPSLMNAAYAGKLPKIGMMGRLGLPRYISLIKDADGSYKVIQTPAKEIDVLQGTMMEFAKSGVTHEVEWDFDIQGSMQLMITVDSHKGCTLEFDYSSKTKILINWDFIKKQVYLDRTAKPFGSYPAFQSIDYAPVGNGHLITFHIFIDKQSIEVFTDHGRVVLSDLIFAAHPLQRFRIIGKQFSASGTVWMMKTK